MDTETTKAPTFAVRGSSRHEGAVYNYTADLILNGAVVGRVLRRRGDHSYRAFVGGSMIANGRTLEELTADLSIAAEGLAWPRQP